MVARFSGPPAISRTKWSCGIGRHRQQSHSYALGLLSPVGSSQVGTRIRGLHLPCRLGFADGSAGAIRRSDRVTPPGFAKGALGD
jgi:hypothetical protein